MPEQSTQSIEKLQSRYQDFNAQKIKVETQRDSALKQLDKIKAEALEKFGTDDLEKLQKQLAEMKATNEQKRIDYQKQLDEIEGKLEEINNQFESAEEEADD